MRKFNLKPKEVHEDGNVQVRDHRPQPPLLTRYDRTHAIARAIKFEIPAKLIADVLHMSIERVTEFKSERTAKLEGTRQIVPLKRTVAHLAGGEISSEQAEVMPKLGGQAPGFYVHQLILLIDSDLLDGTDERLLADLRELRGKLSRYLRE